jgi:hypothetical protein
MPGYLMNSAVLMLVTLIIAGGSQNIKDDAKLVSVQGGSFFLMGITFCV